MMEVHYQILLTISLKEFIKLNVKIMIVFLNMKVNKFKFSNNDINTFILLLRKVVYPYEYMNEWEKFNETSLPMEDTTV